MGIPSKLLLPRFKWFRCFKSVIEGFTSPPKGHNVVQKLCASWRSSFRTWPVWLSHCIPFQLQQSFPTHEERQLPGSLRSFFYFKEGHSLFLNAKSTASSIKALVLSLHLFHFKIFHHHFPCLIYLWILLIPLYLHGCSIWVISQNLIFILHLLEVPFLCFREGIFASFRTWTCPIMVSLVI